DRQHRREDRPVDEEAGEVHGGWFLDSGKRRARPPRTGRETGGGRAPGTAAPGHGIKSAHRAATAPALAGLPIATTCGCTGMPGKNTFCTPLTITRSPP